MEIVSVKQIIPGFDDRGINSVENIARGDLKTFRNLPKDVKNNPRWNSDDETNRISYSDRFGKANSLAHYVGFSGGDVFKKDGITFDELSGQVVLDLGAGKYGQAFMDILHAGARAYIGVELHYADQLHKNLSEGRLSYFAEKDATKDFQISISDEDMLSFLRRVPDNSVSMLMSGITDDITPNQEYRDDVRKEVERVLDPAGAYLSGMKCIRIFNEDDVRIENIDFSSKKYIKGAENERNI